MTLNQLRLHHFNQRSLNMLGYVFGGQDNVRVLLSERAENAMSVILESRTVILDPARTGVFDLALGVRLLSHRHKRGKKDPKISLVEDHDKLLTERAQTEFAPRCRAELLRQYLAIKELTGRYQLPTVSFDSIQMTTRSAGNFKPLPKLATPGKNTTSDTDQGERRYNQGPISITNLEFVALPGIDIGGSGDDFEWLIQGLNSGAIATHTLPMLDDLPFVRIPFRLCDGQTFAGMEWLEEQLSREDSKDIIANLMKCITQKSEVREEKLANGRRTASGVHLDSNRLVDAFLGARSGIEPRLFRNKGSYIEPVFDPKEHLALMAIDLSDVWHHPYRVDYFISNITSVYQRLEVDIHILAYAGRRITLEDGREIFLQFATTVKPIDEPINEAFWGRMLRLIRQPLELPGEVGYFHPLAMQDICRAFDKIAEETSHSYRSQLWWARRWMTGRFHEAEFVMRAADSVDFQMRELRRRLDGTFDTLATYLPSRLRNHGRPGEFLSEIKIPGD